MMLWFEARPAIAGWTRRRFLPAGIGAVTAGALLAWRLDVAAADSGGGTNADSDIAPVPLPWLDTNGNHNQPPGPGNDPSEIYDFNGQVATCQIAGTGTDSHGNVIPFGGPRTTIRFMQGEYVTDQGVHRVAAFAHFWLDLYQGTVAPEHQIHNLHSDMGVSALYGVFAVPSQTLQIGPDGKSATVHVQLGAVDQPAFPKPGATNPAKMTLRAVWTATGPERTFGNAAKHFAVRAAPATARAEFTVEIPAANFSWTSAPLATSTSSFAWLGQEVNGRFFDQGLAPGQRVPTALPSTGGGGMGRHPIGLAGMVLGLAALAAPGMADGAAGKISRPDETG
jgi:hypothetical protein